MLRDDSLAATTQGAVISVREQRVEAGRLALFAAFGAGMGVLGAVIAWVLYHLIMIFTGIAFYHTFTTHAPLYPPATSLGLAAVLIPVGGALIVGVMARFGTDRIRGHGIPEAMEAVLKDSARIGPRVALLKPISAAIAVGTGGPFGAEGPIIQTGGALGSLIGQTMKLSSSERRTLLACGGAAGMAGIFNTPIAAVALALELLLFEFRARSLIPVIVAAGVAAACRTLLIGSAAMFALPRSPGIGGPLDLLWFMPLGIIVGVGAVLISKGLYFVEELVDRLPVSMVFKPAMGAAVLGIIAVFQPLVFGMGYPTITAVLENHFGSATLAGLAIGKAVALVASLGAGTSGGLLAPMLLIGAAVGSVYGRGILALVPGAGINPGICGIVAMSSLFSAAARAPLTSFIFAFELTGDYHAIVPLMIGCMIADVVARGLASESVMTERLVRRGLRVEQGFEPDVLRVVSVRQAMRRAVDVIAARTPLREALRGVLGEPVDARWLATFAGPALRAAGEGAANRATDSGNGAGDGATGTADSVATGDGASTARRTTAGAHTGDADGDFAEGALCVLGLRQRWSFPVVDDAGRLVGLATRADLFAWARDPRNLERPVGELARKPLAVAYSDESLDAALVRLLAGDYALMPVVERSEPWRLIGVLGRRDVLAAWQRREQEGSRREQLLRLWRRRAPLAVPAAKETAREETPLAHAERSTLDPTIPGPPSDPLL